MATPFEVITLKLDKVATLVNAERSKKAYIFVSKLNSNGLSCLKYNGKVIFFLNHLLISNQKINFGCITSHRFVGVDMGK